MIKPPRPYNQPLPPHPAIDWTTRRKGPGNRWIVDIVCPVCFKVRIRTANPVAFAVRKGAFDGRCVKDRWVGINRREEFPVLDGVDYSTIKLIQPTYGNRLSVVQVTCGHCGNIRWKSPSIIRCLFRKDQWSNRCRACAQQVLDHPDKGRRVVTHNYINLSRKPCSTEQLRYYPTMAGKRSSIGEHRLVMAVVLGRPLTTHEVVHHWDGNRQNNHSDNLQLFRRGTGEHHAGHGDLYHELQMALTEIARLKAQLTAPETTATAPPRRRCRTSR